VGEEANLLTYPVYVTAVHEDGARKTMTCKVEADSPGSAIDAAIAYCREQFVPGKGWSMAGVADELLAVEIEDAGEEPA
jgi:hypothetical protein